MFLSSNLDLIPERLALAKELGADFQLKVSRKVEPKQLAKSAEDMLGVQPHVAIECTGVESSIQTAIYVRESWAMTDVCYRGRGLARV